MSDEQTPPEGKSPLLGDDIAELAHLRHQVELLMETVESLQHQVYRSGEREYRAVDVHRTLANPRWIRGTDDGWLLVMSQSERISVPSNLKVDLLREAGGRQYFSIVEGIRDGTLCDVIAGNLVSQDPQLPAVRAVFENRAGGPVTIGGQIYDKQLTLFYRPRASDPEQARGPFPAKTDPQNPVPVGTHDIEIADYPHTLGSSYGAFGTVWFRIGHQGDRYIHPGRVSLGCVTCVPANWPDIYNTLVVARKGDRQSVGTLVVL